MVTWIPSIHPIHVSIYTSTMDPSWDMIHVDSATRSQGSVLGPLGVLGTLRVDTQSEKNGSGHESYKLVYTHVGFHKWWYPQ